MSTNNFHPSGGKDIQANILKGHGRKYAAFVFLTFSENSSPTERRAAIMQFSNLITTHQQQYESSQSARTNEAVELKRTCELCETAELCELCKDADTNCVMSLYLSYKGYQALGIEDKYIPKDGALSTETELGAAEPQKSPFQLGMMVNLQKDVLGDYGEEVEDYFKNDRIHAAFLLANPHQGIVEKRAPKIYEKYFDSVVHEQENIYCQYLASYREAKSGLSREHFGYLDGHSISRDVSTLSEIGLMEEPIGENSFGSFVAVRKLQQMKCHFDELIEQIRMKIPGISREYAMALLMGRFPEGTPLTVSPKELPTFDNSFDYSMDDKGSKCPFSAHIRAVNPRNQPGSFPKIIRRSMTFDDAEANGKRKGLFFISYQSSIQDHFIPLFENMQANKDFITYRPKIKPQITQASFSKTYGDSTDKTSLIEIDGRKLTAFLGGEYFFAPSLKFLKNLNKFAKSS